MALHTAPLVGEDLQSAQLLDGQCALIERRVVRDQGGFIHLDRETPEQREVRFLHRVRIRAGAINPVVDFLLVFVHATVRLPPYILEGVLHHLGIRGVQPRPLGVRATSQHAVGASHHLLSQRHLYLAQHLFAQLQEVATVPGHFGAVVRRADRLGSRAGVIDADLHLSGNAVDHLQYACIGVGGGAGVDAVEGFTRTAIPEEAEVVHRIDHRGRLTTGDPAEMRAVQGIERAIRARNVCAVVRTPRVRQADKSALDDARRTDHPAVRDREVRCRQEGVGNPGRCDAVRIDGVAYPVIRTRSRMATGTGLPAIATGLHVPEKRLAQFDCGGFVLHIGRQIRRFGDGHRLQRCQPVAATAAATATAIATFGHGGRGR